LSAAARPLAWLLLVAGLAGLLVGAMAGAQLRRGLAFGAPLAAPSSLAVDADGRVYAGTGADRIHVYGADGRFVRGWYLDRDAGPVRVRVAAPGRIEVATGRSGRLHVFDRDGQLLETTRDPGAFARFGATQDRVAEGPDGAHYELEAGALVRTAPSPRTVLAPPVRAPLAWFPRAPVPALTAILTASTVALLAGTVFVARRRPASPRGTR
jgi:hypothetical protein